MLRRQTIAFLIREMIETATLVFLGRFHPDSFIEFVQHRAQRLALRAGTQLIRDDRIEVSVSGEADLIDAFEVACTLGPIDCLVLDNHRLTIASPRATDDVLKGVAHEHG
jgi:acylphosphatase